jgi:hypothetical protein
VIYHIIICYFQHKITWRRLIQADYRRFWDARRRYADLGQGVARSEAQMHIPIFAEVTRTKGVRLNYFNSNRAKCLTKFILARVCVSRWKIAQCVRLT